MVPALFFVIARFDRSPLAVIVGSIGVRYWRNNQIGSAEIYRAGRGDRLKLASSIILPPGQKHQQTQLVMHIFDLTLSWRVILLGQNGKLWR